MRVSITAPPAIRTSGRSPARAGLALLVPVLLAVLLGWLLRAVPAVGELDLAVVVAAHQSASPTVARLALGLDIAFGALLAGALVVLAGLIAGLLRHSVRAGARAALLVVVPWALVEMVKLVVRRPRPDSELLLPQLVSEPSTFSFPSGHTACAAAFCTVIVLVLPTGRLRRSALAAAVLIVVATAWSRVVLGVHHPTDVLVSAGLVPVLCILLARLLDLLTPAARPCAEVPPFPGKLDRRHPG